MGSGGRGFKSEMPRISPTRQIDYGINKKEKKVTRRPIIKTRWPATSFPLGETSRQSSRRTIFRGRIIKMFSPFLAVASSIVPSERVATRIRARLSMRRGATRVLFSFLGIRRGNPRLRVTLTILVKSSGAAWRSAETRSQLKIK